MHRPSSLSCIAACCAGSSQFALFLLLLLLTWPDRLVVAQDAPDSRYVFEEDNPDAQERREKQIEQITTTVQPIEEKLNFEAPEVGFDQEKNVMRGTGGVLVSRGGVQMQADSAAANLDSKDVSLDGRVVFTWPEGEVTADKAAVNIDSETGVFEDATIETNEGSYRMSADELYKDSERDYRFFDARFSTCYCEDDSVPWSIECNRALLEDDGYAHTYGTSFNVNGVPILYSPYFIVPVKRTRQSGFLAPTYGYSNQDGVQLQLPFYWVIDDYADATITPFTAVQSRTGLSVGYRKVFSRSSTSEGRVYYSDESARDGDLRGTNVSNLFDPTFDENRFGGFNRFGWAAEPDAAVPTRINSDLRYVSDDLFIREIEDIDIADSSDRYVTSQMLAQSSFGGVVFSEVSAEYNQSMVSDDDLIFQRLPQVGLSSRRSFKPFGFNPYGFKVVTDGRVTATDFVRKEGYDGWRYDINPNLSMPHHYQNFLSGSLDVGFNFTYYDQRNSDIPGTDEMILDDDRQVMQVSYTASTAVERVYSLADDSWLGYLSGLGVKSQSEQLRRVKHVIEPYVRYNFTPSTYQDELPLYDSLDRIRQRSLFTYGFRTSLLGRYVPATGSTRIEELTPALEDIPVFDPDLNAFGQGRARMPRLSSGSIAEVAYLQVAQSYDYVEERKDKDPGREPFSDVGYELGLQPSTYFAFAFDGNVDAEESDMSSYGIGASFRDDRGDVFRARYSYIENAVSQVDGNIEVVLSDRFRLGFFGRYDDEQSEFIESEVALRIQSACNCWYVDLGYTDTINPDRKQGLVRFTLLGLGDLTQNFSLNQNVSQPLSTTP